MTVEWLQSTRGARTSHAKSNGEWLCRFGPVLTSVVASPRTSLGHVTGQVCAFCAIEVNALAILARDEEARSE